MIGWLSGQILKKIEKNRIILVSNDIGYIVHVTETDYKILKDDFQKRGFFIKNIVGESKDDLYGFKNYYYVTAFEDLTSVYRLGASAAMRILSVMCAEEIVKNVLANDVAEFKKIKGIGPKVIISIMETLGKKYRK